MLVCFWCKKEVEECKWHSTKHDFCSEECLNTYWNQQVALQELDYYTNIESKL